MRTLLENVTIVNEGTSTTGSVVIENDIIAEVLTNWKPLSAPCDKTINCSGCYLLPGVIDDHVHFRDPGLTHKADILTESQAAAAGGVTSIMDMPNTLPQTTTLEALAEKQALLDKKCMVNHAAYFGATDNNYKDFQQLDKRTVPGIKLFMGSSTGNMLVDRTANLKKIFSSTDLLIAAHCECQPIIAQNTLKIKDLFKDSPVPISYHTVIRSTAACYESTKEAIKLAKEAHARLHVLHISTARELKLFSSGNIEEKSITAEACVAHILFSNSFYKKLDAKIKCNPSIKTSTDRLALRRAINTDLIDLIATDHAPHLLSEKQGGALKAVSGMPMIQFSLLSMLQLVQEGIFTIEKVVDKMCHAPARLFKIEKRGFIREGYKADLVLVKPDCKHIVSQEDILSKCKWSPLEGSTLDWQVLRTYVNGVEVWDGTHINENYRGEALTFGA